MIRSMSVGRMVKGSYDMERWAEALRIMGRLGASEQEKGVE